MTIHDVAYTGNGIVISVDDLPRRPYSLSSNDLTIRRRDDKLQQQQQQQQQQLQLQLHHDGDDDALILLQKVKELLFLHHPSSPSSVENNNNNKLLFQFYVYDNLTEPYRPETISNCLEKYGKRNSKNVTTMREFYNVHCDWSTSICKPQTYTTNSHYSKRRLNSNADAILARQFLNYTGPLRTYNPNEATIFIVPYPAASLKECYRSLPSKSKKLKKSITHHERKLFKELELGMYWKHVPYKHLFLYSAGLDQSYIGEYIQSRHHNMIAMLGPKKRPGHILIPYANTHPEYQPNILHKQQQQQQQHDSSSSIIIEEEERKYGLAAVLSKEISGNGKIRKKFLDNIDIYFPNNRTIIIPNNGIIYPIQIIEIDSGFNRHFPNEDNVMNLYKQSIFCPIFRGDSPIQKRFFDVLLNGCIPVVMAYYNNNKNNNNKNKNRMDQKNSNNKYNNNKSSKLKSKSKSYFADGNGALVEDTYPFATKTIINNNNNSSSSSNKIVVDVDGGDVGIDYSKLVVEIQPNGCVECIPKILEDLLLNQPNIIKQKQDYIKKIRPLFSYGMTKDNFLKYPDAVSALLYQAQQYVMNYDDNIIKKEKS